MRHRARPFLSELKSLTGNKGGRFLAAVLKHVGTQEPRLIERIFSRGRSRLVLEPEDVVVTEYRYAPKRQADVAVLRHGEVIALGEVKYRDHRGEGVKAQIGDYLSHCRSNKIAFTLLTEFEPRLDQKTRQDGRLRIMTYHQLAGIIPALLKTPSAEARGALSLLHDYLRHEVTMYDPKVDATALRFLVARTADISDQNARNRRSLPLNDVPAALHRILSNMAWIGDELAHAIGGAKGAKAGARGLRATVDFGFDSAPWDERLRAAVHAWVGIKVRSNPWMELRFGYTLRVTQSRRYEAVHFFKLRGHKFDTSEAYDEVGRPVDRRWPNADALLKTYTKLTQSVLKSCRESNPGNRRKFWEPATRAASALRTHKL